ncbi:hypothetical protein DHEL01_v210723 [Diaporthe helianthi]|uniref:Short-chain dehydrogenase n=1 Tax=Diaporthe helianthi TaxID=158607 RepID=A0A2P5HKV5_DIAHE|nr:hypothetical protein DHEL01_v210723 [Diaporthe helianthi]
MAASSSKPLHFLITGAGRGIGRGLSRLLVQRGHRVFLVDNNQEELRHTCDTLVGGSASSTLSTSKTPKPFDALHCNLRQPADIDRAAKAASEFFADHLDVLINNAAFTSAVGGSSIIDSQDDQFMASWAASLETNLTAPLLLSRACLPMLRKQPDRGREGGGSIIHMSSTRAYQSEPDSEGYAATKAGLIGLTHSMAVSLAPVGIRVNAILPGWIHVGNECKEADEKGTKWDEGLSEDDQRWHLNGRVGKVDDILVAVEYLAKADFVTGTEMIVDGGVTRKMVYPE